MKIVIPDDYQDMVDQLECFSLIRHHDVIRYRMPARDLAELVERLESELGKPILVNNAVSLWAGLRLIKRCDRITGYGRLLREHLAA